VRCEECHSCVGVTITPAEISDANEESVGNIECRGVTSIFGSAQCNGLRGSARPAVSQVDFDCQPRFVPANIDISASYTNAYM